MSPQERTHAPSDTAIADMDTDTRNDGVTEKKPRSLLKRFTISVGRLIVFGYITVLVALVVLESRLVYPGAYMNIPPREVADVQSVSYVSTDGTELTGQLYSATDARRTMLYFHGNGTTARQASGAIARLGARFNANVLAAEFRGYDGINGTPSEQAVIDDCLAARDFMLEHDQVAASDLILYGQSLGGGCAVAVAADSGAQLLVLEKTFDRLVDVAAGTYPFVPVKMLMRNRFDSLDRVQNYHGPLVQLHGTPDRLIPIEHAKRLHESVNSENKRFIEVPGMGHNDRIPEPAWQEFCEAIDAALEPVGQPQ